MQLRTQIYLEPSQHAALIRESRRLGLSLAGMIRKLVEDHVLRKQASSPSKMDKKKAALSLIALGKSGFSDVSENPDAHLAKAIYAAIVSDRRAPYKGSAKKKGK